MVFKFHSVTSSVILNLALYFSEFQCSYLKKRNKNLIEFFGRLNKITHVKSLAYTWHMLCVWEKRIVRGFFFCHFFLLQLLSIHSDLNFESNIILTMCSLLCPCFFQAICTHLPAWGPLKNPFTKTEKIINPYLCMEKHPTKKTSISAKTAWCLPCVQHCFPSCTVENREQKLPRPFLQVCLWLAVPSFGQSSWWQMFLLLIYDTVKKFLVGGWKE